VLSDSSVANDGVLGDLVVCGRSNARVNGRDNRPLCLGSDGIGGGKEQRRVFGLEFQ
jgi:hypothetical protein